MESLHEREWYVIFDKKEIIAKFKRPGTAHEFVTHNNKNYFRMLEVVEKEVWEYIQEEIKLCRKPIL